ncbi:Hypothetical_protein [Hexamita inflata]|uniref:Hypothetical_protein n=1 Tax=Hexamita inflata TaxID=28002 RepID=A0AA86QXA6_9EUKA|nr:Hypothetical protein HINF_LOCUS50606 [Hexamita inflata]
MFNAQSTIQLLNVSLQYRFNSVYSAGLLINITQPLTDFQLTNVNMMGHNFMEGGNMYQLVFEVNALTKISIEQVKSCLESSKLQADSIHVLQLSASIDFDCADICTSNENFIYGICANVLQNGQLMTNNQTIMCVDPFVFNGELCVCKNYFVLNGSVCVNLVLFLSNLDQTLQSQSALLQQFKLIQKLAKQLNQSVKQQFDGINNQFITLYNITKQYIDSNISQLNNKTNIYYSNIGQHSLNNSSMFLSQLSNVSSYIIKNISVLTNQLNQSLLQLEQNVSLSASIINQSFYSSKLNISNSIRTFNNETSFLFNFTDQSITTFSYLTDFNIASNISQIDNTLSNLTKELSLLNEILIYTNEHELQFKCWDKLYTFKTFDTPLITNLVTNDQISSGFVFDSYIQNAFINIPSTNSGFTLFKTQTLLQNIKIQFNDLNIGSTAILTPSTSATIQQMVIASKQGTQIQTSGALYIIQKAATQTYISNLLLNISFNPLQTGAVVLIYTLSGQLNVNGYKITGFYYSQSTIALTTYQTLTQSKVSLHHIHLNLQVVQCGNLSSLVLSYINSSLINIRHISIQIGNKTCFNEITVIQTTQLKYFRYAGIITYANSSIVTIVDVFYKQYESWQTQYVKSSGLILGYANCSQISLKIICFTTNITTSSYIDAFGMIGFANGDLTLNMICAQLFISQGTFYTVAIVGSVNGQISDFENIIIESRFEDSKIDCGSALVSLLHTTTYFVKNISISNSSINVIKLVGVLIASTTTSNGTIQLIQLKSSTVTITNKIQYTEQTKNVASFGGGLLGDSWGNLYISTCILINIELQVYSENTWAISGGIIGDSHNYPASIVQSLVQSSNVSASGKVKSCVTSGGIIGYQYDSAVNISDVKVESTNISAISPTALTYSAGLISFYRNQTIIIENSSVYAVQINISSKQNSGTMISANVGPLQALNVRSEGVNTINGEVISNCPNWSVIWSQSGC